MNIKETFTNIYKTNYWSSLESSSGPESEEKYTNVFIEDLEKLFNDLNIKSLLDIPCGDFNWMKNINLSNIEYIGADIVDELIYCNISKYENDNIKFNILNLVEDKLPKCDMIIVRDCFSHFSYSDIFKSIKNIISSGCKYLLVSTYVNKLKNDDIITGDWREINIQKYPFNFPDPIFIFNENSVGCDKDKSLLLYNLEDEFFINFNKIIKFSIITPIYKTPTNKIQRLYNSLLNQSYSNWEWIVFDDSPTDYKESYNYVDNLSKSDNRIKLYSDNKNCGIIGEVKRKAFFLANGDVLVEVDHDDELVNTCIENLKIAYEYSDEIGFVYGHACELYEDDIDGKSIIDYGDYFAFGYGYYSNFKYKEKEYKVSICSNINPKTIRHIVGVPNHVRSWRKEVYYNIGGHNKNLEVADDYELLVRTFLNTKMAKINVFTYIQYFERNSSNTQFKKNRDIQELVYLTANFYNDKIHKRFLELKIDDYVYVDSVNYNFEIENPKIEQYSNIIIPENLLLDVIKVKPEEKEENKKDVYAYSRVYNIESTLQYKKTEHYYNIIKWLVKLTNCQSYLELGVEYGTNIIEIKNIVKICVGVDINAVNIPKDNLEFYQMTTDDFFKQNNKKFDIIFIDANHNFEQVKKDFDNSLSILNKFGVIILHDTDPINEDLLSENHCHDSYKIIDYISSILELNIITFPIQETGMTFVMRKDDRRINEFKK